MSTLEAVLALKQQEQANQQAQIASIGNAVNSFINARQLAIGNQRNQQNDARAQQNDTIDNSLKQAQTEKINTDITSQRQSEIRIKDFLDSMVAKDTPGVSAPLESFIPSPMQKPGQNPVAMELLNGQPATANEQPLTMESQQPQAQAPTQAPTDTLLSKFEQANNRIKSKIPGFELNPNHFVDPKADLFIPQKPDANIKLQEQQDQFNQKEWDKIVKDTNPLTASNRNPLGSAAKANFNADRAITALNNPMVTNQEAGNVMADIASIYQNGSPTQFGMQHQQYETLKSKIAGTLQYFSGKPTDALTPEIKSRLLDVLAGMKQTNFGVIKQQIDYTEKSKKKIIDNFPEEWQGIKDTLLTDATPAKAPTSKSFTPEQIAAEIKRRGLK